MNRTALALVITCFTLFSGCATEHRETWPDGGPRRSGSLRSGRQVGPWSYWWPNGRLQASGDYAEDAPTGHWKYFHDDGSPDAEGDYRDELRDGYWQWWWRGGGPRARGFFAKGREVGLWTFQDEQGRIVRQGEFDDGHPVGRWIESEGDGSGALHERWAGPEAAGEKLVVETAPEGGAVRCIGLVRDGRRVGRWSVRHASGAPWIAGDVVDDAPQGRWIAWNRDGSPLAMGEVKAGRAVGEWQLWIEGVARPWRPESSAPPPSFDPGGDVDSGRTPEASAHFALEFAAQPLDPAALARAAAVARVVAAADARPKALEAPIQSPPSTVRDERVAQEFVAAYGMHPPSRLPATAGTYDNVATSEPDDEGDEARARRWLGRPFPITRFRVADGRTLDLASLQGRKVLIVVLRGFASGVCVYCDAQTKALSADDARGALQGLGVETLLVYPGPESGWEAFLEAWRRGGRSAQPPFPCLFDKDLELVNALGIPERLALPTSLILDEEGIVRFVYVGRNAADRPSARRLVEAIRELRARP